MQRDKICRIGKNKYNVLAAFMRIGMMNVITALCISLLQHYVFHCLVVRQINCFFFPIYMHMHMADCIMVAGNQAVS